MHSLGIGVSRVVALLLLAAAAGCASASTDGSTDDDDDDEADLGVTQAEVQAASSWKQFAIVQDGSQASKATGALEVPMRGADGQPAFITSNTGPFGLPVRLAVRGTCGVTFIAPHYAVTAAHCVAQANVPDPPNNPLTVRQIDVTNASLLALNAAALIKGKFPNYLPLSTPMQNVAGYQSTALSCKVVSRCAISGSAAHNCDFSADIAMLHCSGRAANAPWLPVAASDPLAGPVEMYWFHELLSPIPLDQPTAGAPAVDFDRFAHYTALDANGGLSAKKNNWHYIAGPTNALLPLKSIPWSNGAPRQRLFNSTSTDLFGCHGTSGSGVLQRNASGNLELLGPVKFGTAWASSRLCNHPDTFAPTTAGLGYESNTATLRLQSKYSWALRNDRYPIFIQPSPIVGVFAP